MMMSHKNKDGILKLLDLGKESSMISQAKKGYFQVNVPEMPMDVFMKVDKDMVVISNNMKAMAKKAKKVMKRKNRIKLKDAAQLLNSSTYITWNIPETMKIVSEMDGMGADTPQGAMMNMGKDSFSSLVISADKKVGQSVNSVMSLNFNNKNMNSLEQIFGLINDLVMSMGGGSSM